MYSVRRFEKSLEQNILPLLASEGTGVPDDEVFGIELPLPPGACARRRIRQSRRNLDAIGNHFDLRGPDAGLNKQVTNKTGYSDDRVARRPILQAMSSEGSPQSLRHEGYAPRGDAGHRKTPGTKGAHGLAAAVVSVQHLKSSPAELTPKRDQTREWSTSGCQGENLEVMPPQPRLEVAAVAADNHLFVSALAEFLSEQQKLPLAAA